MKNWWLTLQTRERRLVTVGGVLFLALTFHALVWEPYSRAFTELETRVAAQRELLVWMEQAAREVRRLRGAEAGGQAPAASGQSLLATVDRTAKARGLGEAVKRVQPEGTGTVRVWMEQAPFDQMLLWLDTISSENHIRIGGVVAERGDVPGKTNARLVLEGTP